MSDVKTVTSIGIQVTEIDTIMKIEIEITIAMTTDITRGTGILTGIDMEIGEHILE